MSYLRSRLLTLLGICLAFAPVLCAQRDIVKRELEALASPVANERIAAALRIAEAGVDISADLRVAYKFGDQAERVGLLHAAQLRGDAALVDQAALALSDDDERLTEQAREYLLKLDLASLQPDESVYTDSQIQAWQEFVTYRLRRDIALVLLDAHLMPGKFIGQFEALRAFGDSRLEAELLAFMTADPATAEPLNLATLEVCAREVAPERAFQASWRRLQMAAGAMAPAFEYLNAATTTEAVTAGVKVHGRSAYFAALEVAGGVRAAAVRALAECPASPELPILLQEYYTLLLDQSPEAELAGLVNLDGLCTEIELALARFGDNRLLTARIDNLRAQIQRVAEAQQNVNMQASARPDLIAQSQIAHLLLRAGDAGAAEAEWQALVDAGLAMLGGVDGRNRSSLSSYLAAAYYNLACAQSLQLKASKALASLREAVRYGYKDFGWILDDGDLEAARALEDFIDWFEDVAPPSVADRLAGTR